FPIQPEQALPHSNKLYVADAALPHQRLDIEVDGYWHVKSPEIKRSDRIQDLTLEENGWRVLRIWSKDLFSHEDAVFDLLEEACASVLRTNKKMWLPVQSVTRTDRFETVHSFECVSNHNYVADGLVVHNCRHCQNADISQRRKVEGIEVEPQDVVRMTLEQGGQGLAYTYNQPTIFLEFPRDIGMRAQTAGLV